MSVNITSLAPEILGEIFQHCSFYCSDAPIILAGVSQAFCRAAHGTPCAWRKLRLSLTSDERRLVRKAAFWFNRAGSCSLDLFVDITATEESQSSVSDKPIAELYPFLVAFLRHHRPRIQILNVRSDTELKAFHFIDAIYSSTELPSRPDLQLQSLRIRITSDIPVAPSTWSPVFESFSQLPGLQSLKLTNHVLPALNTPTIAHLRFLTISRPLRAHPLPVHKILRIIGSTPALERLEVDSRIMKQPLSELAQYTNIPLLKSLSLRTNNLSYMLNLIATPSLEKLYLDDLDGKRPTASQELSAALEELSDKVGFTGEPASGLSCLDTLEVEGVSFSAGSGDISMDQWELCIRRMSSLTRLMIRNFDEEELVNILTSTSGLDGALEPVCPRLSYLCLSGSKALIPLHKLNILRPYITVEWETIQERNHQPSSSVYVYGAGGFGFGSRFHFEQMATKVESRNRTVIPRMDPDSDGPW
ncbi:hypothetical protein D9758_002143 [Tetrapyrgos nigripes]|uniref:F-box domain-containing protein n=1 Tax=Tetrapyrgos nigripes TaxID=182062 RepID=A0A8H5LT35_9AGAR|nr:hypothetical protein D9758_002143 [Tetrapyrgos nigripes]